MAGADPLGGIGTCSRLVAKTHLLEQWRMQQMREGSELLEGAIGQLDCLVDETVRIASRPGFQLIEIDFEASEKLTNAVVEFAGACNKQDQALTCARTGVDGMTTSTSVPG